MDSISFWGHWCGEKADRLGKFKLWVYPYRLAIYLSA